MLLLAFNTHLAVFLEIQSRLKRERQTERDRERKRTRLEVERVFSSIFSELAVFKPSFQMYSTAFRRFFQSAQEAIVIMYLLCFCYHLSILELVYLHVFITSFYSEAAF